jgi:hypothetical protein
VTLYRMQMTFTALGEVEVRAYRREGEAWLLDAAGTCGGETGADIVTMAAATMRLLANGATPAAMRATIDQLAEHVKREAKHDNRQR